MWVYNGFTMVDMDHLESRSTSHALSLARRLREVAKQQGSKFIIAFLDWEKAFEKVAATVGNKTGMSYPHLFLIVMSDVEDRHTLGARRPGVGFDRIYYADDTVLLALQTEYWP